MVTLAHNGTLLAEPHESCPGLSIPQQAQSRPAPHQHRRQHLCFHMLNTCSNTQNQIRPSYRDPRVVPHTWHRTRATMRQLQPSTHHTREALCRFAVGRMHVHTHPAMTPAWDGCAGSTIFPNASFSARARSNPCFSLPVQTRTRLAHCFFRTVFP